MADTSHLTEYTPLVRHRREMRTAARQRRIRLIVGIAVVSVLTAGGYWLSPPLGILLAGIGAMVLFFTAIIGGSSVQADLMAGIEGEVRALDVLKQLPDEYVLFNQVQVPDGWLPNGRRELDFIVVGPAGVAIVEVKNTPGMIYVEPDKKHWEVVRRAGCGSRPGWNKIDNPLYQVRAQVGALDRWLLSHGISADLHPIVCFARPDVWLENADQSDIPVLRAAELGRAITGLKARSPMPERQQSILVRLVAASGSSRSALAA